VKRALLAMILAGCGRFGFGEQSLTDDALAFDAPTDAPTDSSLDAPTDTQGMPIDTLAKACLGDPDYETVGSLAHRYRTAVTPLSWSAAQADCMAAGAHLVIFDDATEHEAFPGGTDRWVGYTDAAIETIWRTVLDTTPTFLPWNPDEPDGDVEDTASDCTKMDPTSLDDEPCADPYEYICECE